MQKAHGYGCTSELQLLSDVVNIARLDVDIVGVEELCDQWLYWLYTAVIHPMLCYAAVVWWTRTQLNTVRKQLEHLQRLACLYITGAKRTAPTAALELIIGIPPLAVYIKKEAMASCFRLIINNAQWVQTTSGHTKIN